MGDQAETGSGQQQETAEDGVAVPGRAMRLKLATSLAGSYGLRDLKRHCKFGSEAATQDARSLRGWARSRCNP